MMNSTSNHFNHYEINENTKVNEQCKFELFVDVLPYMFIIMSSVKEKKNIK